MKLCNKVCKECGNAVFLYKLSYWDFYRREWDKISTAILCPKCDKVFPLPYTEDELKKRG